LKPDIFLIPNPLMLLIKSLHIIFVVTWFAGLFYLIRLFIYHVESVARPETESKILIAHFKLAAKRLWYGITWPSAIATLILGTWLTIVMYGSYVPDWLWLKIFIVLLLFVYHLISGVIFYQLQHDVVKYSSQQLRIWNEVATIFLVAIIFIVVYKDLSHWLGGLIGFLIFGIVLLFAIRIYRNLRKK
jgi:protoporphyrinogen IX oxidase